MRGIPEWGSPTLLRLSVRLASLLPASCLLGRLGRILKGGPNKPAWRPQAPGAAPRLILRTSQLSTSYIPSHPITRTRSTMAAPGRYVPPHLRNRQAQAPPAAGPQGLHRNPVPASGGPARTTADRGDRWSSSSAPAAPPAPHGRGWDRDVPPHHALPPHHPGHGSGPAHNHGGGGGGPPGRGGGGRGSGRSLFVFGDSFVGPFKLLRDDCAKTQTFKGASAKVGGGSCAARPR